MLWLNQNIVRYDYFKLSCIRICTLCKIFSNSEQWAKFVYFYSAVCLHFLFTFSECFALFCLILEHCVWCRGLSPDQFWADHILNHWFKWPFKFTAEFYVWFFGAAPAIVCGNYQINIMCFNLAEFLICTMKLSIAKFSVFCSPGPAPCKFWRHSY